MNRQEAITELENLAWVQGGANRDKATEAISMAIKALKEPQLPVVKCKDCVYLGNSVGDGIMEEFHVCMKKIIVVKESGLCIWGKEKEDE